MIRFFLFILINMPLFSNEKVHTLESIIIQNNHNLLAGYLENPSNINTPVDVIRYEFNELAKKYEDRWIKKKVKRLPLELCIEFENYPMIDSLLRKGASWNKCEPLLLIKVQEPRYFQIFADNINFDRLSQQHCYTILKSVKNIFKKFLIENKIPISKLSKDQQHWIFDRAIWDVISHSKVFQKNSDFSIIDFLKSKNCHFNFKSLERSILSSLDENEKNYNEDKNLFNKIFIKIKE